MQDPAQKYFTPKTSDRDRAVFEAGIAIGTLIHQFTGIPIRRIEDVELVEEVIKRSLLSQPFREEVEVKVNIEKTDRVEPYNYTTLKSRHIDARIRVKYGKYRVTARLKYIPELDYTLGYIEDISGEE